MTSGAGGRLLNKKQELNTVGVKEVGGLDQMSPRPVFSSRRGSS